MGKNIKDMANDIETNFQFTLLPIIPIDQNNGQHAIEKILTLIQTWSLSSGIEI